MDQDDRDKYELYGYRHGGALHPDLIESEKRDEKRKAEKADRIAKGLPVFESKDWISPSDFTHQSLTYLLEKLDVKKS
jgi:hypothetical protein